MTWLAACTTRQSMEPGVELAPYFVGPPARGGELRGRAIVGTGLASLLAIAVFIAILPLSSLLCVAGMGATCMGIAAVASRRKGAPTIIPEDIADPVLRVTYRELLSARLGLERALLDAPGFAQSARSLRDRSDAAVRLCGRLAPAMNRAHAYLATGDASRPGHDAAELRTKAASTADPPSAHDLRAAAAACERELATRRALEGARDRTQARLDFVLASLRAFTARITNQQTLEDERLALASESVSEHVEGLDRELAAIESTLDPDLAA